MSRDVVESQSLEVFKTLQTGHTPEQADLIRPSDWKVGLNGLVEVPSHLYFSVTQRSLFLLLGGVLPSADVN